CWRSCAPRAEETTPRSGQPFPPGALIPLTPPTRSTLSRGFVVLMDTFKGTVAPVTVRRAIANATHRFRTLHLLVGLLQRDHLRAFSIIRRQPVRRATAAAVWQRLRKLCAPSRPPSVARPSNRFVACRARAIRPSW